MMKIQDIHKAGDIYENKCLYFNLNHFSSRRNRMELEEASGL